MIKATAEVFADHQHGPGVTVCVDDVRVSVYLYGETGIVTKPSGQHGIEVTGPWHKLREQIREMVESTGESTMGKRLRCNWYMAGISSWDGVELFRVECRGPAFSSELPVREMSYCPYCGGWLAVHSQPRVTTGDDDG